MQFEVKSSPYVTGEGHILIYPGEKLVFRFEVQGDRLSTPEFVRAEVLPAGSAPDLSEKIFDGMDKTDPNTFAIAQGLEEIRSTGHAKKRLKNELPGTLWLSYRAIPGTVGMMLTIEHNLPRRLKLDAFIMRPTSAGWDLKYTSTCEIPPLLSSGENWPEPLGGIILENFRLVADDKRRTCE